jgi:hypothetical protein
VLGDGGLVPLPGGRGGGILPKPLWIAGAILLAFAALLAAIHRRT